jgi:2-polyprenyl-3-methyl-5-hydroxy-6-metoxy-1,4-benzoquinol methylase
MNNSTMKCDICGEIRSEPLWIINNFNIVQCANCGLVYSNVSESDTNNIYEKDYYTKVYPDYESDRNIHDRNNLLLIRDIERFFSPGSMIEIGSAFGFFADAASKRGWKFTGFETSEYASTIAKTRNHQNVLSEDFITSNFQGDLDVVCMFDTIEHLLKPSLYIEKIAGALKKGGGLVITTGDLSSLLAKIQGKSWRMVVPPLHVFYYTQKTLSRLLTQYGFKVLDISHPAKYQNLNSMFKYQFGINKALLPKIPIKINFGDIMLVIAQKE